MFKSGWNKNHNHIHDQNSAVIYYLLLGVARCAVCVLCVHACVCFCVLVMSRLVFLLYTGTIISIQFDIGDDEYAMHCPNLRKGCYKEEQRASFFEELSGTRIEEQFEIHLPRSRKNPRIKSGDKVVFRSVHKSNRWFDCSSRNDCTITECQNNAADPSNSSYITDCGYHLFRIYAVGKEEGKAVRTSDQIQFKHVNDSSYLNCLEKKCVLDICESGCTPQTFTVEKIQ